MDGQQQLPLMHAYSGVVSLSGKLGVLVDEPRLPQHVGRADFDLDTKDTLKKQKWPQVTCGRLVIKLKELSVTLLEMWESIIKLWTCFSALVSSSFLATTATTSTVQPAPCNAATTQLEAAANQAQRASAPAAPTIIPVRRQMLRPQ